MFGWGRYGKWSEFMASVIVFVFASVLCLVGGLGGDMVSGLRSRPRESRDHLQKLCPRGGPQAAAWN